jgi:hypothetical protein
MKAEVSEEAKREARRIAKEELEKRLKEIDMTPGEWGMYEKLQGRIRPQVWPPALTDALKLD